MTYLRIKQIKNKKGDKIPYLYLCKTIRKGKKVNQKVIKYIGRVKGLEILTKETIQEVFLRDGCKCRECGREDKLTIDHVVALSKGGKNNKENLQVLCELCNIKKSNKMKKTIKIHLGDDPYAVYFEDDVVKLILEEKKLTTEPIKDNYPNIAIELISTIYDITKPLTLDIIKDTSFLGELKHTYYGMCYSNHAVYDLVSKSGLYYRQYLHDPNNPKFTTPSVFFGDVAKIIKSGKKVGWFQGRWAFGDGFDYNRCILELTKLNYLDGPPLYLRLMDTCNFQHASTENLGAYNPVQAIQKLKEKEIDVLVIGNLIVFNNEGDFNGTLNNK